MIAIWTRLYRSVVRLIKASIHGKWLSHLLLSSVSDKEKMEENGAFLGMEIS